ncbi:MAG: hypothetical protein KKA19_03495, partial [Candidatus Margulisbacteria bacterium]|nr:hypothetical protein [Candidatus Margulisiibacteriota bacterium]
MYINYKIIAIKAPSNKSEQPANIIQIVSSATDLLNNSLNAIKTRNNFQNIIQQRLLILEETIHHIVSSPESKLNELLYQYLPKQAYQYAALFGKIRFVAITERLPQASPSIIIRNIIGWGKKEKIIENILNIVHDIKFIGGVIPERGHMLEIQDGFWTSSLSELFEGYLPSSVAKYITKFYKIKDILVTELRAGDQLIGRLIFIFQENIDDHDFTLKELKNFGDLVALTFKILSDKRALAEKTSALEKRNEDLHLLNFINSRLASRRFKESIIDKLKEIGPEIEKHIGPFMIIEKDHIQKILSLSEHIESYINAQEIMNNFNNLTYFYKSLLFPEYVFQTYLSNKTLQNFFTILKNTNNKIISQFNIGDHQLGILKSDAGDYLFIFFKEYPESDLLESAYTIANSLLNEVHIHHTETKYFGLALMGRDISAFLHQAGNTANRMTFPLAIVIKRLESFLEENNKIWTEESEMPTFVKEMINIIKINIPQLKNIQEAGEDIAQVYEALNHLIRYGAIKYNFKKVDLVPLIKKLLDKLQHKLIGIKVNLKFSKASFNINGDSDFLVLNV